MDKFLYYFFTLQLLIAGTVGCSSSDSKPVKDVITDPEPLFLDIVIGRTKERRDVFACGSFDPSAKNFKRFLSHAKEVTPQVYFTQYIHLPCSITGALRFGYNRTQDCNFVFSEGGVMSLYCMNGKNYYFVCDDCGYFMPMSGKRNF